MNHSLAHRKAAQKICFTDKEGKKLSNTSVKVKLVNHKFLFGNGAFDSLPATSEVDMGKIDFYHGEKMPEKRFFEERVEKWCKSERASIMLAYSLCRLVDGLR